MSAELSELQAWFRAQCDGDWEHSFGIKIETLDNPGWSVTIDLAETQLVDAEFAGLEEAVEDPERWVSCRVSERRFLGACGPAMLPRVLGAFLEWSKSVSARAG
jgi:Immunity protein 53